MAIFDVTSYGAVGNYDFTTNTGTDDAPAFAAAVAAAKAAGSGNTVYVPGGKNYLLASAGDPVGYPNAIIPNFDSKSIRFVGDAMGQGGTKLVIGVDKDVFRVGYGNGVGGWLGLPTPPTPMAEGYEISGFTIQARKGFYATSGIVFHVYNALSADIHNFNITDYGFTYAAASNGPAGSGIIATPGAGSVFALWPNGYTHQGQSLNGLPMAQLPRPGVPQRTSNTGPAGSDPRGWDNIGGVQIKGWASADMGQLAVGAKYEGAANYKNMIHDGQINGTLGSCMETGLYNNNLECPQGCGYKNIIAARSWSYGCIQYSGDGSNSWDGIYSFQHKGGGFMYLPPAGASTAGVGYGWNLNKCGSDYNGDHGFYLWDQTSGGQKVSVAMADCYSAGSGQAPQVAQPYPTMVTKKGILLQNNICMSLDMKRCTVIANNGDGAEVCANPGPLIMWDNYFGYNAVNLGPSGGSGCYVNGNSLKCNIQRNTFDGVGVGPWPSYQAYGLYFNNFNISIYMLLGNNAPGNQVAGYNLNSPPNPITLNANNI